MLVDGRLSSDSVLGCILPRAKLRVFTLDPDSPG
jgi:hypothetical protein